MSGVRAMPLLVLVAVVLAGCGGAVGNTDRPHTQTPSAGALSADGISVELPDGWSGRILIGASGRAVLHAATFPVEANDTDEGKIAKEAIGINGIYLNVRDVGSGAAGEDLPISFDASDFEAVATCCKQTQATREVSVAGEAFRITAVSGNDNPPPEHYLDELNEALASLSLTAYTPQPVSAATGDAIGGYGLHANLPPGWTGGVARGEVHAGDGAIDLSINEFDAPGSESFVTGRMPLLIGSTEFVHQARGMGYETGRSFIENGRQFQLWVRSAHEQPSPEELAHANAFLASFTADGGDFYPGTVEPATFAPAAGWNSGNTGAAEIKPDGQQTMSWTSTIPYRDSGLQFPPTQTLEALPPGGIVLVVWLQQYRQSDAGSGESPFRLEDFERGSFEGIPPENDARMLRARTGNCDVTVWALFGRAQPADEQLQRAQAELDRLRLPDWPSWN
jgi:hypothetical protein